MSNVDETAQKVDGDLVIGAKAIFYTMYGASEPLEQEEKRTLRCWGSRKASRDKMPF